MGLETVIHRKKSGNSFYWAFEDSVKDLLQINAFTKIKIQIKEMEK